MTTHTAKVTVRRHSRATDAIMAIYASARKYMAANGNPTQWGNGYRRVNCWNRILESISFTYAALAATESAARSYWLWATILLIRV